ncbi:thymidine phosphorylase [Limibacillus sp. MBR-115]|jgi:thymidine phosphorylase|uniref:thymidine phosphorylase n=1 Tax=Limibacillus sp. MBR-115 TaxID=3156465 RepID=UPI00339994AF
MEFFPQEVIRTKRDGKTLSGKEITQFINAMASGALEDSQAAAFAMAVYFQGMSRDETGALTLAMANSGQRLFWPDNDQVTLDKHSTGGVGDKVSLILAPLLASCGARVPMIAGRGLGHTGGTLDKLDSIPGYDTQPSLEKFQAVVAQAQCAIVGQTAELAPADRKLYAIRDVTATVESIPLITASVLSKKIAAGLDHLVMDVKVGSGAFMKDLDSAKALATSLVESGNKAGLPVRALLTDMNEPLGLTVGNTLEVLESIDFLTGKQRESRLLEVTLELGAAALEMAGLHPDSKMAKTALLTALDNGSAAETFGRMVAALGGPTDLIERAEQHLRVASVRRPVTAGATGYLSSCDAQALGLAVMALGGGRKQRQDRIDHSVGFRNILPLGSRVEFGQPIAEVVSNDPESAEIACDAYRSAIVFASECPAPSSVVISQVGS